jgi:O-antigen/teichoic acid export membrane protein
MLRSIFQSPALRAAVAFGFGGITFTLGNLILARVLSSLEYGVLSLVIGVLAVAALCAPMGLDYVIARRGLALGPVLRRRAAVSSLLVGLVTAGICAVLYHLEIFLLLAILVTTLGTGISQSVAAHFQGQRQFALAMPFTQMSSWVLTAIAVIAWGFGITTATVPAALIAGAALITAATGWFMVSARTADVGARPAPAGLWSEAISLMTINVAGSVLLQLERLVIPKTIGIEHLALFGVAASLVGSAFRMLYSAVHFTVIPRLRDAGSVADRRRLLRREFLLFGIVMAPTTILIWLLSPPIAHWFLGGRYDLDSAIILAMIISGLLKLLSAFGTAIVSALAPDRGLWMLSTGSWLCIALSVYLAFLFRRWGVCGAIYAVSVGWLGRTCISFWISAPHLRLPADGSIQR